MEGYSLKWQVSKEYVGIIIKDFLNEQGISRRALTDIKFNGGLITVNGEERTVRYVLQELDMIEVTFPLEEKNEQLKGECMPLSILYEDRDIIVLDKPPYMNTIPSREHPTGSLANGLVYYYEQIRHQATVHIVTRLDRNTSGIVLVAKHRHAHHLLSVMQQKQEVYRYYEAFVRKKFTDITTGTVDAPIGRDPKSIIERVVRDDGQRAVTHYKLLQQYQEFSHLRLKLETGRTHQIRVHMAYIGHPLLGDELYGGTKDLIMRQALHCKEIQFTHPFNKERLTFHSPFPFDMAKLL